MQKILFLTLSKGRSWTIRCHCQNWFTYKDEADTSVCLKWTLKCLQNNFLKLIFDIRQLCCLQIFCKATNFKFGQIVVNTVGINVYEGIFDKTIISTLSNILLSDTSPPYFGAIICTVVGRLYACSKCIFCPLFHVFIIICCVTNHIISTTDVLYCGYLSTRSLFRSRANNRPISAFEKLHTHFLLKILCYMFCVMDYWLLSTLESRSK